MHRRRVLRGIGTGAVVGLAGCSAFGGGGGCGPGQDELGALADDLAQGSVPERPSVRGLVAGFLDPPKVEVTGDLLVLDDGTGRAVVYPPRAMEFNPEVVSRGTCFGIEGSLNASRSRTLHLPVFQVQSREDISEHGSGDPPARPPDPPAASFEYAWTQGRTYDDVAVELTHGGGGPVPSDELLVVRQGDVGASGERYWHELAGGMDQPAEVTAGDSIYVGSERGALVWTPTERWRRPLVLWPPGRWRVEF